MVKKLKSGSGPKKIDMDTFNTSKSIHDFSRNNAKLIKKSKKVGCFYCLKIYAAKEIKNYRKITKNSAICKFCSIDSVIPDAAPGIKLTDEFLRAMKSKWFNS